MYCSNCGVAVTQNLSYCNHCGTKLGDTKTGNVVRSGEVKAESVIAAMVMTFVLGLFAITALIGVLKSVLGLEAAQILGFATLCFLIMIVLEGVFLRLLFRRHRKPEETRPVGSLAQTKELEMTEPRALREPAVSVTDHTTRTFEPVYVERSKGE